MEKVKQFLAKPVGMILLVVIGFGAGYYIAKRKKTGRYGR